MEVPKGFHRLSQSSSVIVKVKVEMAQSSRTLCDPLELSRPEYWSG